MRRLIASLAVAAVVVSFRLPLPQVFSQEVSCCEPAQAAVSQHQHQLAANQLPLAVTLIHVASQLARASLRTS